MTRTIPNGAGIMVLRCQISSSAEPFRRFEVISSTNSSRQVSTSASDGGRGVAPSAQSGHTFGAGSNLRVASACVLMAVQAWARQAWSHVSGDDTGARD